MLCKTAHPDLNVTTKPDDSRRHISLRQLEDLVPYARNARTHSPEQLAKLKASMLEFGWTNPVIADDKGIVAGHGRIMAARELYAAGQVIRFPDGTDIPKGHVPVVDCTGWSDAKRKAYILADNRLALDAGWDDELLALELADLRDEGFDLELTGFSEDEIDDILDGLDDDDDGELGEEDAAPEPQPDPVSRTGDVWICGGHRLMCGDSTSIDAAQQLMGGRQADLLLTDPPYNVAYEGKTEDVLTIENDSMEDADFRQFLRDVYSTADAVMRPGAAFYIWHADSEGYNFRGAAHDVGWRVRQCLIWNKNSLVLGRQDYHWKHEPCLYGWKDGAAHYWGNDRKQTTVLDFNRPSRNGEHPTMKPVDLFWYQVDNSSKRGDVVLDLFGGSGTTMIACEKSWRHARLMELDPKYCDVIVRRWQEFTGKAATLEASGETFAELEAERVPANDNSATPPSTKYAKSHRGLMTAGRPFTETPAANDADGARDAVA